MRWRSVVPARGRATQLCYLSFWGSGIQPRLAGASASRSREAVPGCRPGLWPMHRSTWRVQDHSRWRDSALHELLGERHPFLHFAGGLTPLATWASSERTSLGGQAPVTPICNGSLSFCAVRFRSPWGASQGARPVWGPHPRPTLRSSYRPPGLGLQRRSYCVQCDNCVFFSRFRNCSLGCRTLR